MKIKMPNMNLGSDFGGVKSEISGALDINGMINGKIEKVQSIANKAGIKVTIPKVNIPTGGITKSIDGSFGDVEKTIQDSQKQMTYIDVDMTTLKEAGLSEKDLGLDGLSFG